MIKVKINELTAAEEIEVFNSMRTGTVPQSVFDDVAELQNQMKDVLAIIDSLNNDFVSEKPLALTTRI